MIPFVVAAADVIPLPNLALAAIPVFVVIAILWRWSLDPLAAVVPFVRMVAQLLLVGYVLAYVFGARNSLLVVAILTVMLVSASLIAIRTVSENWLDAVGRAIVAILVGGVPTLGLVTAGVLRVEPWYDPSKVVPLAGMVFANAMNGIGLAAERYESELGNGRSRRESRNTALRAALIPITNSFLAVGIVSFPGMMTGQILSGVDPLIAVRYQIVVMCMVFGAVGVSTATYLAIHPDRDATAAEVPPTKEED